LQPKPQAESDLTAWNDFCHLVLKIVDELSPCPEPTLFVVAANRGLQRFGDGSLGDLSKLLERCVKELQARGLVEIKEKHLVITPALTAGAGDPEKEEILDQPALTRSAEDEDILDLTTVTGSAEDEGILELTAAAGSAEDEDILDRTTVAGNAEDEGIFELTAVAGSAEHEDVLDLTNVAGGAGHEDIVELTTVAGSAEDEDVLELTAVTGTAGDEDILELTAELELHPSLPPSKLDKAPTKQEQLQTQEPVSRGPKRGPEPTREEIIAAMRKFMSDE
jgi:hypothetical protein